MNTEDLICKIWAVILSEKFSNTKVNSLLKDIGLERLAELAKFKVDNEFLLRADKEINQCIKENIEILTIQDEKYPNLLFNISDPPLLLFVKGQLNCSEAVGIVGSRLCTDYGLAYSRAFSRIIAKRQISVVSGLANGIDSAAHHGAIESGCYPGIGVLGCGLHTFYPANNKPLYESLLVSGGAIISEYGLFAKPRNYLFPRRNRIISGLSKLVLVIEANLRSGSLITARCAYEQGRDVLALPGSIDSEVSSGCNKLISEGAKIICSSDDLINYLEDQNIGKCFSKEEVNPNALISELKTSNHTVESLSEKLNQPLPEVYANLLTLELKGLLTVSISGQIQLSI